MRVESALRPSPGPAVLDRDVGSRYHERLRVALASRYELGEEVGSGGMATVYRATDLRHDRSVAIKVFRPELASAIGSERFLREIRPTANLQHPHILPLHDSGEADGLLYYVMPFVDGESLRDRLEAHGELPIPEVIRILTDVAEALAHAHEHGIVHRDIKPGNVLLSGRNASVADFGVAKALQPVKGGEELTTEGLAIGTPTYMAPEQVAGDAGLDHRADLYALGVVGYEMLAGRPPFVGDSPQEVVMAHLATAPEDVSQLRAAAPDALSSIVMRCLEKKPADRWQTARHMVEALEGIRTSGETHASSGSGPRAIRRPRKAVIVGTSAIVVIEVATWTVLSGTLGGPAESVKTNQSGTAAGSHRPAIAVLPFDNISGDSIDLYFTDGIHDEIITQLSRIQSLSVISRTSVMSYRDQPKPLTQIAAELGVSVVLEGSIRRGGNRVRVTAQLIDAGTDEHLWADQFDRDLTPSQLIDIQSAIAQAIAAALQAELLPQERQRIATTPTTNLQAYELFLQANLIRDRLYWGGGSREDMTALLREAVALDPEFAIAWAALARSLSAGTAGENPDEREQAARAALATAGELAPNSAET